VEALAARPSEAVKNVLRSGFMSHSKCAAPRGTADREQNDGESRTILNLDGINKRAEPESQQFRGAPEGVEGEDRPGKAPSGEASLGALFEPVKARHYEIVRRLTQ
jgi:hypothetical protein